MLRYREIRACDIPQIVELFALYLNSGESISQSIRDAWASGDFMGYTALADGKIAGFLTLRDGIVFTYPHPELEEEIAGFAEGRKIGYCDALLVLPEHRANGVAEKLAEKSRKLLLSRGYELMMAEIWIYPDGHAPAKTVFESMGKPVLQKRVDGFYRDLAAYGMGCPVCGEHCVCGAWVEVMEL